MARTRSRAGGTKTFPCKVSGAGPIHAVRIRQHNTECLNLAEVVLAPREQHICKSSSSSCGRVVQGEDRGPGLRVGRCDWQIVHPKWGLGANDLSKMVGGLRRAGTRTVRQENADAFWVRVDTAEPPSARGKVGLDVFQWDDTDPIPWVSQGLKYSRGQGTGHAVHQARSQPRPQTRGLLLAAEPDHRQGTQRFQKDRYVLQENAGLYTGCGTLLRCNKGHSLDGYHEACISGVCRDFNTAYECAGCINDNDCKEKTYVGKDCLPAHGWSGRSRQWQAGTIAAFSSNDHGAPNNGNVNVRYSQSSSVQQSRSAVYPCDMGNGWSSGTRPAACAKSCARSSELCPLERPGCPI